MDHKQVAAERRERQLLDLETEKVKQLKRIADSLNMLVGSQIVDLAIKEGFNIENCKRVLQPADVRAED